MPSVSGSQQRFMGAAYGRAQAGHPRSTDPKMSVSQLRDFASTKTSGLPDRVKKASTGRQTERPRHYGSHPVRRST